MSRSRFPRLAAQLRRAIAPVPVQKLPPLRYGLFSPDGQLVKVCETSDPRQQICKTFNEMRQFDTDSIARPITNDAEAAPRRKAVSQ